METEIGEWGILYSLGESTKFGCFNCRIQEWVGAYSWQGANQLAPLLSPVLIRFLLVAGPVGGYYAPPFDKLFATIHSCLKDWWRL